MARAARSWMETVLFPDDLSLFMVLMGRVCDNIVPFRVSNTLEGVEIFLPPSPSIDFYVHILRNKKIYNFNFESRQIIISTEKKRKKKQWRKEPRSSRNVYTRIFSHYCIIARSHVSVKTIEFNAGIERRGRTCMHTRTHMCTAEWTHTHTHAHAYKGRDKPVAKTSR